MTGEAIAAGDTVRLKSGGPVMTVAWVRDDGASCQWFDSKNELKTGFFQLESIVKDDGKPVIA